MLPIFYAIMLCWLKYIGIKKDVQFLYGIIAIFSGFYKL